MDYIKKTPVTWMMRYPVYLKALESRLEKLPQHLEKDKKMMAEIKALENIFFQNVNKYPETFPWHCQEWRVSCFAQQFKTMVPVSKVRLLKILSSFR